MANKIELIEKIATKTGLSKSASKAALQAMLESVTEELTAGEKVILTGFGTFEVRERAAREGRNPQTGETIQIAASKLPSFKAGKNLKDSIKK